ncbi:MAG: HNH endonuclease signature motif containing protein [Dehalococcoidia bacterium]
MHPDTIIASRFWEYVRRWQEQPDWWAEDDGYPDNWDGGWRRREDHECWPWPGHRTQQGYGVASWLGEQVGAHRVAYELTYGPLPPGRSACHHCDYPPCSNPAHLYAGTAAENGDDRKQRRAGTRSSIHYLNPAAKYERYRWERCLMKQKQAATAK